MKKKLFVGAAVGTAGLVALTGATFAHGGGGGGAGGEIKDRVAEILGIEAEDLQDAFEQARDEHRDEQIAERLANAVEEGVITQAEADEIIAWLDAMPVILEEAMGHGRSGGIGHLVRATSSDERIATLVERLVAVEKIGEEDVDAVTDWLTSAPTEALQRLSQHDGDGDRPQRRNLRGRMFGEGPNGQLFEGRFQIRPYTPPVEQDSDQSTETDTTISVGEVA